MNTLNVWPKKRRNTLKIRVDPDFKKFIEEEYPNAQNPERTRIIMDKLLGRKKK